jgi:hypothetical protein
MTDWKETLHYHALNYRTASQDQAHAMWLELEDFVNRECDAERERCAKVASEFLTKGRSPLGRAVYDEIMGKGDK